MSEEGSFLFLLSKWWGGVDVEGQVQVQQKLLEPNHLQGGELRPWRPGSCRTESWVRFQLSFTIIEDPFVR